jgi:hypothetical protein
MACHGVRREAWMMILIGVTVWFFGEGLKAAGAADKETRVFTIRIDDKPAGYNLMTISRPDEETFIVDSRADVSISYLIKTYKYQYLGTEVWKHGRLFQLESKTSDDGKQFQVLVKVDGDKLRVRVNGNEHLTRRDVWTTTYWRLPELQFQNQSVALLDCDTGKELHGTVRDLGMQQLTVRGQTQNCVHYQIRGEVIVDVWYDVQKRLVRQDALDDGHHVVLELTRVDR